MRVRTTAVAVLVVGLATVVGAGVLVAFFRESLLGELETAARLRAAEIAVGAESGAGLLAIGDGEDILVQLVDAAGRVTASSPSVAGLPVLARPLPDDAAEVDVCPSATGPSSPSRPTPTPRRACARCWSR